MCCYKEIIYVEWDNLCGLEEWFQCMLLWTFIPSIGLDIELVCMFCNCESYIVMNIQNVWFYCCLNGHFAAVFQQGNISHNKCLFSSSYICQVLLLSSTPATFWRFCRDLLAGTLGTFTVVQLVICGVCISYDWYAGIYLSIIT